MFKAIKVRLYPNKTQRSLIDQTLGCCRFIYNWGLEKRITDYNNGIKTGYCQINKMLTKLKHTNEFAFLKNCDAVALQQSLRNLDRSYINFFEKRAKYPRFKSKHNHRQSYRTSNSHNTIRIENKHIKLPKMGFVKIRQTVKNANILYATVEKLSSDKYFAVLIVKFEPKPRPNKGGQIGIDLGIKHYHTDSNGNVVENPKNLKQSLKQLARTQLGVLFICNYFLGFGSSIKHLYQNIIIAVISYDNNVIYQ